MPGKRKFIFYGATSVDGFIARLDGSVDWLDRPQAKGDYGIAAFYRSVDTVILGRKTYDFAVNHGMPDVTPDKKTYVFSRTLKTAASPKVSLVTEDANAFAERLRAKKGKNIWLMGGGELLASFLDCGQVDEFILHVIPTMIGEGIPLVAPRHRDVALKLLESKKFPDDSLQLHYDVIRGKR